MSTDHGRLLMNLNSMFLVGGKDLDGDTTGGEAAVPKKHEGDQQDTTKQSLQECGATAERVEGKIREEATQWGVRSVHSLSGFNDKVQHGRSNDYGSAGNDSGVADGAGWNG